MITKKTALKLMIGLLSIVILFHLSILFQVLSYEVVWAGKLNSLEEMYAFETLSILMTVLLLIVLLVKFKNINKNTSNKVVNAIIWAFVVIFGLNTIGNLFSESTIELLLGTSLTLLSTFLCWVIVKKEKNNASHR